MDKLSIIAEIKKANEFYNKEYLTRQDFADYLKISISSLMNQVTKYFDNWTHACKVSDVKPGPSDSTLLKPNKGITEAECLDELRRVGELLPTKILTKEIFKKHSNKIHPHVIAKKCGGWKNAVEKVGCRVSDNYREAIPIDEHANFFLKQVEADKKIPTLNQIGNRSEYDRSTFKKKSKPGVKATYSGFKILVINHIIKKKISKQKLITDILLKELKKLEDNKEGSKERKPLKPKIKKLLQKEINSACPICNNKEVDIFEFHHIDGNRANDVQTNLLMICPNCHKKITNGDISERKIKEIKKALLS